MRQRIPLVIRNSRNPENEGTRVVARQFSLAEVRGIACMSQGERTVVAMVGRGVRYDDEILERAISALGDLHWRMQRDASSSVLAFSLPHGNAAEGVGRLHREFFERELAAGFRQVVGYFGGRGGGCSVRIGELAIFAIRHQETIRCQVSIQRI